jgi:hypothetical protein
MTETAFGDGGTPAPPTKAKGGISFGIDYSYRPTNPYSGTHAVGLVVRL